MIQPFELIKNETINVQKGQLREVEAEPIVAPVKLQEEVVTKSYYAPSKETYIQPIKERRIINTKEEVEFVPSERQIINLNPIAKEAMMRENQRIQTIFTPGNEIYREKYI